MTLELFFNCQFKSIQERIVNQFTSKDKKILLKNLVLGIKKVRIFKSNTFRLSKAVFFYCSYKSHCQIKFIKILIAYYN